MRLIIQDISIVVVGTKLSSVLTSKYSEKGSTHILGRHNSQVSAHKPIRPKSVSPLSEFCNQELRHNSIFVLVTVDWGTSPDIAVSLCSFPECAILNFCYS